MYLPGGQELTATTEGVRATRYYTAGGTTVAVRTEAGDPVGFPFGQVEVIAADPHGTGQVAFNTHTGAVARRYTDPYGTTLGATGTWAGDRGFLDKPVDATGYVHVGARYYDPAKGRFLSVDPVMDLTDPAQWHAYAYANNNPITYADPTGLKPQQHDGQVNKGTWEPKHQNYTPGYTPVGPTTTVEPPVTVTQCSAPTPGFNPVAPWPPNNSWAEPTQAGTGFAGGGAGQYRLEAKSRYRTNSNGTTSYLPIRGQDADAASARNARSTLFGPKGQAALRLAHHLKTLSVGMAVVGGIVSVVDSYQRYEGLPMGERIGLTLGRTAVGFGGGFLGQRAGTWAGTWIGAATGNPYAAVIVPVVSAAVLGVAGDYVFTRGWDAIIDPRVETRLTEGHW